MPSHIFMVPLLFIRPAFPRFSLANIAIDLGMIFKRYMRFIYRIVYEIVANQGAAGEYDWC